MAILQSELERVWKQIIDGEPREFGRPEFFDWPGGGNPLEAGNLCPDCDREIL